MVGGNLVSWKSKKPGVTAKSSAEVEYQAATHGFHEFMWLKILLGDIGFQQGEPLVNYLYW